MLLPIALLVTATAVSAQTPLIFDTDMGNDIDDALALAVIHALETRNEAKLIAVTLTKDNRWSAPFVDLVNHFYGRGTIPIGVVRNGKTPQDAPYTKLPSEKRANGRLAYPRRIMDGSEAPEAAGLIRKVLESQPDGSVAIAQVGFSTNFARLLDQPGAKDLIARKVKLLSIMAGQFPTSPKPEYNVRIDVPAFQKLVAEWPTEIVFSGFEIGLAIEYPAKSIERDFRYVANHPIVDAYHAYKNMPYDRPTWDLTSVLFAIRPDRGYFSLSDRGTVTADAEGRTKLTPSPNGRHRYLIVSEVQKAKTLEALIQLASQPPSR